MRTGSSYLAAGLLGAVVALTFQDPRIDESSGLVVRHDTVLTVNDSGDGPHLYAVDRRTGATLGVTTFAAADPVDVEALAAGRGGTVWVGDIGDNRRARDSVTLHRFRPVPGGGSVRAATFGLRYPDGPHDAETLLVHPRTGRVLVVSKRPVVGGVVYRAPSRLDAGVVHRLTAVARVPGLVTDGAFLPDGRHVVLRTYGSAAVYTYPGFEPVAAFDLPAQRQGEAIAIGSDGRVYLSTEGPLSDVLAMDLPDLADRRADPDTDPGPDPRPDTDDSASPSTDRYVDAAGAAPAAVGTAVAGLVLLGLVLRAARRRGRRRR